MTVTPIQMGVKFKPPSLILSYTSSADDHTKLRRRSMPIRGLGKNSDCYAEAENMKSRHVNGNEEKCKYIAFLLFSLNEIKWSVPFKNDVSN